MTQLEKEQKQAELRAEMAGLQTTLQMKEDQWRALEATPVTSYKVWAPAHREYYWDSGVVSEYKYYRDENCHTRCALSGLAHQAHQRSSRTPPLLPGYAPRPTQVRCRT